MLTYTRVQYVIFVLVGLFMGTGMYIVLYPKYVCTVCMYSYILYYYLALLTIVTVQL